MADDATRTSATLDPRDPFVLDTGALARQPGAMRRESLTRPAPADLRLEMIGVPEGADVRLDLRLEAVMEGVLASGDVRVPVSGECARCLDTVASELDADFQELYLYPESEQSDDEEPRMDGDLIDLEQAVRNAVVLALPHRPLCREDCPGLCARCGVRLADAEPGHSHEEPVDPRWQGLQGLLDETDRGRSD